MDVSLLLGALPDPPSPAAETWVQTQISGACANGAGCTCDAHAASSWLRALATKFPGLLPTALLGHQVAHFARVASILQGTGMALDVSRTGAGKTVTTLLAFLALPDCATMVVVAPSTLFPKWVRETRRWLGAAAGGTSSLPEVTGSTAGCVALRSHATGAWDKQVILFTLAAVRGGAAYHPPLTKGTTVRLLEVVPPDAGAADKAYVPTREWLDIVARGAIVVVDESHNVKNASQQAAAVHALCEPLVPAPPPPCGAPAPRRLSDVPLTGVLHVSATPFDKPEHVLRRVEVWATRGAPLWGAPTTACTCGRGCINAHVAWAWAVALWRGAPLPPRADNVMYQLVHLARQVREAPAGARPKSKRPWLRFAADLWSVLVVPSIVACMEYFPSRAAPTVSMFVPVSPGPEADALRAALEALRLEGARADVPASLGPEDPDASPLSAFQAVEVAKAPLFAKAVLAALAGATPAKVVVAVNYLATLHATAAAIRAGLSSPDQLALIHGAVPRADRVRIMDTFQANTGDILVLAATSQCIQDGHDLDDTHGGWPRYLVASPSYGATQLQQLLGRVDRAYTASASKAAVLYASCGQADGGESAVLAALRAKALVLKGTLRRHVAAGMLFPGEFPNVTLSETAGPGATPWGSHFAVPQRPGNPGGRKLPATFGMRMLTAAQVKDSMVQ